MDRQILFFHKFVSYSGVHFSHLDSAGDYRIHTHHLELGTAKRVYLMGVGPRGGDRTVYRFMPGEATLPYFSEPVERDTMEELKEAVREILVRKGRELAQSLRELADSVEPK